MLSLSCPWSQQLIELWLINVNLVFLNCVLQVVYELKIADAICAGTKGATIKGGTGGILSRKILKSRTSETRFSAFWANVYN